MVGPSALSYWFTFAPLPSPPVTTSQLATGFLPDYMVQVEAILPGLWNASLAWIPGHVRPLKPSLLSQAIHFSSPPSPQPAALVDP